MVSFPKVVVFLEGVGLIWYRYMIKNRIPADVDKYSYQTCFIQIKTKIAKVDCTCKSIIFMFNLFKLSERTSSIPLELELENGKKLEYMYRQLSERTSSIPLELELENGKKLEHMYQQLSGKNIPLLQLWLGF